MTEDTKSNAFVWTRSSTGDIEYLPELSPTLTVGGGIAVMTLPQVFENHGQDTRYRPLGDICQTVSATFGMGGNNQPLVVQVVDDER